MNDDALLAAILTVGLAAYSFAAWVRPHLARRRHRRAVRVHDIYRTPKE